MIKQAAEKTACSIIKDMELNKIWNESNEITMKEHIDPHSIDLILTSPPYNNCRDNAERTNDKPYVNNNNEEIGIRGWHKKYDVYEDQKTTDEYCDWIVSLFKRFDVILKENGVILWNTSYQNENNEGACWLSVADVIRKSNFTVVDHIVWKKNIRFPVTTRNKLSHLCEDIFVFVRKEEWLSFNANKKYSKTVNGQNFYIPVDNFIEAPNNDEVCAYNHATFSTELCRKLMNIYVPEETVVYDPFMGSGTTGLACKQTNRYYIGSEISENQCAWAENRIKNGRYIDETKNKRDLF